jgi:hypothetical protein
MRALAKVIVAILVILVSSSGIGWAADFCLTDSAGDYLVGKGFILPTKGNCKPFNGYFSFSKGLITGTACGTSDNSTIRFYLQYGEYDVQWSSAILMSLDRFTLTGVVKYCHTNGSCSGALSISKVVCSPAHPFH